MNLHPNIFMEQTLRCPAYLICWLTFDYLTHKHNRMHYHISTSSSSSPFWLPKPMTLCVYIYIYIYIPSWRSSSSSSSYTSDGDGWMEGTFGSGLSRFVFGLGIISFFSTMTGFRPDFFASSMPFVTASIHF